METIEHFANISFVARMLGGERLLSREEVLRLQGLRGMYGIASPAPICADPLGSPGPDPADCQVVQAPAAAGERLVAPDRLAARVQAMRAQGPIGADEEIRLTYGELTALIEDAVRSLK
jgi:L-fuculose-phosphate aldolase